MGLFKEFKTDQAKETNGIKATFGPNTDGTTPSFLLARMGRSNVRYTAMLERECRPYRRLIDNGTLDPVVARRIEMKTFCSTVLLGWDNVQDQNDALIPFTVANALSLFELLPDLYDELKDQATKASSFRVDELESAAKN